MTRKLEILQVGEAKAELIEELDRDFGKLNLEGEELREVIDSFASEARKLRGGFRKGIENKESIKRGGCRAVIEACGIIAERRGLIRR